MGTDKQAAGFKYGKYATRVIRTCGEIEVGGRKYRLVFLQTSDGQHYYSLRLYNPNGHFIKQMLFEPAALEPLAILLFSETKKGGDMKRRSRKRCKCGHPYVDHHRGQGVCYACYHDGVHDCTRFRPQIRRRHKGDWP